MKRILVPLDFSPCSLNAFDAAIQLQAALNAEIHVLHVIEAHNGEAESYINDQIRIDKKYQEAEIAFADLKSKNDSLKHSAIELGEVVEIIESYVSNQNIDFVVMGTHGTKGVTKRIYSSNTSTFCKRSKVPVWAIKRKFDLSKMNKTCFISAFDSSEKPAYQWLLNLNRVLKTELDLLCVDLPTYYSQSDFLVREALKDFKQMAWHEKVKTNFIKGISLEKGILNYLSDNSTDLIVIVARDKSKFFNLFRRKVSSALIKNVDLPILIIPEAIVNFKNDENTEQSQQLK